MSKIQDQVIHAFYTGRVCRGRTLWTDGSTLYSYEMPIANWGGIDQVRPLVVKNSTSPSQTTSKHINALKRYADTLSGYVEVKELPMK